MDEYEGSDEGAGSNGDIDSEFDTSAEGGDSQESTEQARESDTSGEDDVDDSGGDTSSEGDDSEHDTSGEGNVEGDQRDLPFLTQPPAKVRRILRNLLSHLSSDRVKAFREASRSTYLEICSKLAIVADVTMSKSKLHDAVVSKVCQLLN